METIEPGQTFEIAYGEGKALFVWSLSLLDQVRLSHLVQQINELEEKGGIESLAGFELIEDAVKMCLVDDSMVEKVNGYQALGIAMKTLNLQRLTPDEKKTSEL